MRGESERREVERKCERGRIWVCVSRERRAKERESERDDRERKDKSL